MNCAWDAYMKLVPKRFSHETNRFENGLQELRLRLGRCPELVVGNRSIWLKDTVAKEDIDFVINIASRYSPWTATSVAHGYITAQGGHRVGVCGEMNVIDGHPVSVRFATSVSLRVARDFPNISGNLKDLKGSVLMIGCPGSGKTTLLRDLVRKISTERDGAVVVVDERQEIFPYAGGSFTFPPGSRTDVLSGCSKTSGIEMALKTMSPQIIAVDEITSLADCNALMHSCWCGVSFLATAHASSIQDLKHRAAYRPLLENHLFEHLIILRPDKSWILKGWNNEL